MKSITVRMLGEISLQTGDTILSDNDSRTKKIWLLLGYLICQRGHVVPQRKLIELLWGDEPASSNPENALRITFHRMRGLLNQLWPTAGHDLILHKENGYTWNEQVPITVDFEQFDRLCTTKADSEEQQLQLALEAIALYRGDFMAKQSTESWVIPIGTHYHNLYINTVLATVPLLSARSRHGEAALICRTAAAREPYHEPLHQLLMQELAADGNKAGAGAVYDALCKRLFDDFGIRPGKTTRDVYRTVVHTPSETALPMDEILEHLQEPEAASGALQCDYDQFKLLCYVESRAMVRSGKATHVLLLSVSSGETAPLPRRTLNRVMQQLGEQIRLNLRRGDVFSRCSVSQYVIMLPQANYENSCMVCRRVVAAFRKAHPHVTAKVNYMVQPLSPNISVP